MNASDKSLVWLVAEEVKDFQLDPKSKNLSGFLTGLSCEWGHFMVHHQNPQF